MSYARDSARVSRQGIVAVQDTQALRDLTWYSEEPPDAVLTFGDSQPGDGLEGVFWWNAKSTAADDGINIIQPTNKNGDGRWVRLFPSIGRFEENIQLLAGQTNITFNSANAYNSTLFILGFDADSRILWENIDYSVVNEKTIELNDSYPEGTVLIARDLYGVVDERDVGTPPAIYLNQIQDVLAPIPKDGQILSFSRPEGETSGNWVAKTVEDKKVYLEDIENTDINQDLILDGSLLVYNSASKTWKASTVLNGAYRFTQSVVSEGDVVANADPGTSREADFFLQRKISYLEDSIRKLVIRIQKLENQR